MKEHISLFIIVFCCSTLFSSCEKSQGYNTLNSNELITKNNNNAFTNFNVTFEEASMLSKIHCRANKDQIKKIKSISPIIENGDTLLYITNFADLNGWMIISGDKRTKSILASFDKNNFDIKSCPSTVNAWLTDIKETIIEIKKNNNKELNENTSFWNEIDRSIQFSKQQTITTKGGDEDLWLQLVYVVVETDLIQYDIPHLTQTKWGQTWPWNNCVPYTTSNLDVQCMAGCVAIAGAQMAYYLHYKIGKPVDTYANGIINGYIPDNFSFQFNNLSSTVWDNMGMSVMDNNDKSAVVALIGYIGKQVNMDWGATGSKAYVQDLANYFNEKNISTSYIDFDKDLAVNSLLSQMPFITKATDISIDSLPTHAWIIDGLLVKRDKYTYFYQWMPRWTYPPVEPEEPDWNNLDQYVISDPVYTTYTYFRMNWGEDLYGFNNFDGNYCYGNDWYYSAFNLIYGRKMLYNFQ